MNPNRLGDALLRLGASRYRKKGIGDSAHYMALQESDHPALIMQHVVRCMAARRREARA